MDQQGLALINGMPMDHPELLAVQAGPDGFCKIRM